MLSAKVHVSPERTPETEPFWDAANDERFLLKRCLETGKAFHPPRSHSPFTGLAKTEWIEASGTGTIYSYSVTERGGTPNCIAYIELSEGPIVLGAMTECDPAALEIGQAVRTVYVADEAGQKVPMFALAGSSA